MTDVPGGCEHDVGADVRAAVPRPERPRRDVGDDLRAPDHRPAEGVRAENRLRGDVVDEVLRVVVDHRDLFQDHLALRVHVVEQRREHHVLHRVECLLELPVRHARVEDGGLARGGGVQLTAHRVEQLGDLLRAVARRALEQQVLDEVRHARAGARLVREPVAIQSPSATDRAPDTRSLMTRSPPGRVVASGSHGGDRIRGGCPGFAFVLVAIVINVDLQHEARVARFVPFTRSLDLVTRRCAKPPICVVLARLLAPTALRGCYSDDESSRTRIAATVLLGLVLLLAPAALASKGGKGAGRPNGGSSTASLVVSRIRSRHSASSEALAAAIAGRR